MRVLITGGSGVIGQAAVRALLERGHAVRLLSRHADEDVKRWPHRVEAWPADIGDAAQLRGSADGCDAVLHVTGIVTESPPAATFQRINIDGARHMAAEAWRAGVRRFVYVSSLGADRGESDYHKSKREGERIVMQLTDAWTVVRPGNVYGPGDEQVSLLLKIVRSLPVVPVLGGPNSRFQPIWAEDPALALALVIERDDLNRRVLEVAGGEQISIDELVDRIGRITDRRPRRLTIPSGVASVAMRVVEWLGADLPFGSDQLTMLDEGNVIDDPAGNALMSVLGIEPTPLDDALRSLADSLPEQFPEHGVGRVKRKRFWADIADSRLTPSELFEHFRRNFARLTPWHLDMAAEPGTPDAPFPGATLTLSLPLRGNVQVRVEEMTPCRMTLVTLAGHPLAGAVRFLAESRGEQVRFEVQVFGRASNLADWVQMNPIGSALQSSAWRTTVENVVVESGGHAADGIEERIEKVDDQQADHLNKWMAGIVTDRLRKEAEVRSSERA